MGWGGAREPQGRRAGSEPRPMHPGSAHCPACGGSGSEWTATPGDGPHPGKTRREGCCFPKPGVRAQGVGFVEQWRSFYTGFYRRMWHGHICT